MKKSLKRIGICALLSCLVWGVSLLKDKHALQNQLIRLHVVAASDTAEDQAIKLQVRDAVVKDLQKNMRSVLDTEQARAYLQDNLPKIEALANDVLHAAGSGQQAIVSLQREVFPVRFYDTFTLPSGIYEALRITIGEGKGHNWWCVVYPALCVGATVDEFEASAQCAGLSDSLTATLSGEKSYEVRFLLLDAIGKLENFLHTR